MENAFWFYGKFFAVLGIVSSMVVFHYATRGFGDARSAHVWQVPGARPERGADLIRSYGCSSCHAISGINSRPIVGPSLVRLPEQLYIAGKLANTPRNLIHWIQHPEQVRPGTAMPNLYVGDEDGRDIAAYLLEQGR
ncbi:cytochrome c family protein [Anatilimnocola sp. NA78]|uniref:c-type cytochrome n=1 Tax=Anatilimnocola sp. NA78 TaxID=3415683 RepID=UPI003CE49D54